MDESDPMFIVWAILANIFAIFWIVDYVIQCCIIRFSPPDCCGQCECFQEGNCGCFLGTKLGVDGLFLFGIVVNTWIVPMLDSVMAGGGARSMMILRAFGLLIFVKLGLEI